MTAAEHIAAILRDNDDEARALGLVEAFLAPDHAPRGVTPGAARDMDAGAAIPPPAGARCTTPAGDDPQSGPIYCGRPAALCVPSRAEPASVYVLCDRHARLAGVAVPNP